MSRPVNELLEELGVALGASRGSVEVRRALAGTAFSTLHRTRQQVIFSTLFIGVIDRLATDYEVGRFDPRNERSAEIASRLSGVLNEIAANTYGELYFPTV